MGIYVNSFELPSEDDEGRFASQCKRVASYDTTYPWGLFQNRFSRIPLEFGQVTILYGENGCGKSTILNLLAAALGITRVSPFNKSPFFDEYVSHCRTTRPRDEFGDAIPIPSASKIITSDDVFQHILHTRATNETIEKERKKHLSVWDEYNAPGARPPKLHVDFDDPASVKAFNQQVRVRKMSARQFVRSEMDSGCLPELSNGESAYHYFAQAIAENSLFLLDEPENSMSPSLQLKLCEYLTLRSTVMGTQLIIATHSPIILAMEGAKVYDLDSTPWRVRPWYELRNPQVYYRFFKHYAKLFEDGAKA